MKQAWLEQWKQIEDYPQYEVSDKGRVRKLIVKHSNHSYVYLHPQFRKKINSYPYVELYKDSKRNRLAIHRLVALTFIPNPDNKPQINHIDGNKLNPNSNNLEWATCQENQQHAHIMGLHQRESTAQITKQKYIQIKASYIQALDKIANDYKVSKRMVLSVISGKYHYKNL